MMVPQYADAGSVALGLREIRLARGWEQKQLAAYVGVSVDYVRQIEQGKRVPTYDLVLQLAAILDCSTHDILGVFQ